MSKPVRMPTTWRLPFGYTVTFTYLTPAEVTKACGPQARGCWVDFNSDKVGQVIITKEAPDEMLDTLVHEMHHAFTDWTGHAVRPLQRGFLKALLSEAAQQAAEEA